MFILHLYDRALRAAKYVGDVIIVVVLYQDGVVLKLIGAILVGDTSDSHRYMEWLRTDADISGQRKHLHIAQMLAHAADLAVLLAKVMPPA